MTILAGLICTSVIGLGSSAQADVSVSSRHLYLLTPGLDSLWGSYLVEVNVTGARESVRIPLNLPLETVDFMPQEGASKEEVMLDPDGQVYLSKVFDEGVHRLAIGFSIPAQSGFAKLSLKFGSQIGDANLLAETGLLTGRGSDFKSVSATEIGPGKRADMWVLSQPVPGQIYSLEMSGIPEGRTNLWYLGSGVALVLSFVLVGLGYRSRPSRDDRSQSGLLARPSKAA